MSIVSIAAVPALAQSAPSKAPPPIPAAIDEDGTYKIVTVYSENACISLCKAEAGVCRGTIAVTPDQSKPEILCRLNNGFGSNPAFPRIPPQPLDLNIALNDLNQYRAQNNLAPIKYSPSLILASQSHADDRAAAGKISHEGSDGKGHGERLLGVDYRFSIAAENVASGQRSWEQVFKAWQDSPGHNVNLLRDDVTDFGVAVTYNPLTAQSVYWVMLVAAPLSLATQY